MRSRAAVEEAAGEISGTALGFGRRQGRGGGLPLWLVRWGSETGESEGGDETGEIGTREEYDRWAGSLPGFWGTWEFGAWPFGRWCRLLDY
jgi:hypothetical protein